MTSNKFFDGLSDIDMSPMEVSWNMNTIYSIKYNDL